jgi:hypothetical protein
MNDKEIQEHAKRIANINLEDIEYAYVYEDENLENASEEDWLKIHDFIQRELVTIPRNELNQLRELELERELKGD